MRIQVEAKTAEQFERQVLAALGRPFAEGAHVCSVAVYLGFGGVVNMFDVRRHVTGRE